MKGLKYNAEEENENFNNLSVKDYPITSFRENVEIIHGVEVTHEYEWLENSSNPHVLNWINSQNQFTTEYFKDNKKNIAMSVNNYYDYQEVNDAIIITDNRVVYVLEDKSTEEQVVVVKTTVGRGNNSTDSIIHLNSCKDSYIRLLSVSKDGRYLAYAIHMDGQDKHSIAIYDMEGGRILSDVIENIIYSNVAWYNDGFFYSKHTYPKRNNKTQYHSIFYHKLGISELDDKLIYFDENNPDLYHFCDLTHNDFYFILYSQKATGGFTTKVSRINSISKFIVFQEGFEYLTKIVDYCGEGVFLLHTNCGASKYNLIKVDINNLEAKEIIIPECNYVLYNVISLKDYYVCYYLRDAKSSLVLYDKNGNSLKEMFTNDNCTISPVKGKNINNKHHFIFDSFTNASKLMYFEGMKDPSPLLDNNQIQTNGKSYIEEQVIYKEDDGFEFNMFIVYKKGVLEGKIKTVFLYGYGGFGESITPWFDPLHKVLLDLGVILAFPTLRGGGEYGKTWHDAGKKNNKQNVINDYIDAAKYLKEKKYFSKNNLILYGASNGGLLVGATIAQKPNLASVAIIESGVLDMIRYHKLLRGNEWIAEYGSADSSLCELIYLLKYSPLQNIKEGKCYPAMYIMASNTDDRVDISHSLRFTAKMQRVQSCESPILLRVIENKGHGEFSSVEKDRLSGNEIIQFILINTNHLEG